MRFVVALLMIAHGFAHLVGFLGGWRLTSQIPYKTTLFAGHLDIGHAGVRALGLVWLATGLAFAAVGVGAWTRAAWWPTALWVVTGVSLVMCLAAWPEARVGVGLNVLLLAAAAFGVRWLT